MTIRDASEGDRAAVLPLWQGCLADHGAPWDPAAFERTWAAALDPAGPLGMRVALLHDAVAGLATRWAQLNSWTGALDGCLDTLAVAEGAKGRGLGRLLLNDLRALGAQRGWRTIFWHVGPGNAPARALYDGYGRPDGFLRYRIDVAAA